MSRTIIVSSRALGTPVKVRVIVYDTVAELRAAGEAYNGSKQDGAVGLTQARTDGDGRVVSVLVRLARGRLGTQIVTHEMHHATTALYGAHQADVIARADHLTHFNEPFAHLHSDLVARLVDRLYELGYYGEAA